MEEIIRTTEDAPLLECWDSYRDIWCLSWNVFKKDDSWFCNYKKLKHKPTINEIKEIITSWCNSRIAESILNDFTWEGHKVWLSLENQMNYKAMFEFVSNSNLPTCKFGEEYNPVYYKFKSVEEFKKFYSSYTSFILNKVNEGFTLKQNIDWSVYEKLLE